MQNRLTSRSTSTALLTITLKYLSILLVSVKSCANKQRSIKMAEMSHNVKRKLIEVEEIPEMKRLKISTIDDKTIQNTSCSKCNGLLWIPQSKGSNILIHLCDEN